MPDVLDPADVLAIQRLYVEYNRAIHSADASAWARCFAREGVFSNSSRTVRGREELTAYADGFTADRSARYLLNNLIIEPQDDHITGSCYLIILAKRDPGPPLIELTGIYTDRLIREQDGWVFAARHIQRDLSNA